MMTSAVRIQFGSRARRGGRTRASDANRAGSRRDARAGTARDANASRRTVRASVVRRRCARIRATEQNLFSRYLQQRD